MPKPNERGSLMNLRTALPKIGLVESSPEMERQIFGETQDIRSESLSKDVRKDVQIDGQPDIRIDVKSAQGDLHIASTDVPPQGSTYVSDAESQVERKGPEAQRVKYGIVLLNAKIPSKLHTQLKRTAQFNDVSMTDILIRGIESELASGRYLPPPEVWGG